MMISSGSASSRIRPRSAVRPSTRARLDADAALERVVVDEADRVDVELRVAQDLAQDEAAALAGADDEDAAAPLPRADAAQRALVGDPRDEPRAADERQREQEEQDEDARRRRDGDGARPRPDRHRVGDRDEAREHEGDRGHRLDDAEVVAVAGVAPLLDLEAQEREDDERRDDDPHDRRLEEAVVFARHATVEAQSEAQVVRGRHQRSVDRQLDEGVPMKRKSRRAQTSAHPHRVAAEQASPPRATPRRAAATVTLEAWRSAPRRPRSSQRSCARPRARSTRTSPTTNSRGGARCSSRSAAWPCSTARRWSRRPPSSRAS